MFKHNQTFVLPLRKAKFQASAYIYLKTYIFLFLSLLLLLLLPCPFFPLRFSLHCSLHQHVTSPLHMAPTCERAGGRGSERERERYFKTCNRNASPAVLSRSYSEQHSENSNRSFCEYSAEYCTIIYISFNLTMSKKKKNTSEGLYYVQKHYVIS